MEIKTKNVVKAFLTEKQVISILFTILGSIIWSMIVTGTSTYMHERVHGAINEQYGIDSKYGWKIEGIMFVAYTEPILPVGANWNDYCTETCKSLHIQNEIVTYNLESIASILWGLFIISACALHFRCFDDDKFMAHMEEKIKYYELLETFK